MIILGRGIAGIYAALNAARLGMQDIKVIGYDFGNSSISQSTFLIQSAEEIICQLNLPFDKTKDISEKIHSLCAVREQLIDDIKTISGLSFEKTKDGKYLVCSKAFPGGSILKALTNKCLDYGVTFIQGAVQNITIRDQGQYIISTKNTELETEILIAACGGGEFSPERHHRLKRQALQIFARNSKKLRRINN
jgi:thioredoxin reductase